MKEEAIKVFESSPLINELFETTDKKLFSKEDDAKRHVKSFKDDTKKKITKYTREDLKVKANEDKPSEMIELIKLAKDVNEVKSLITNEARPIVLDRAKKRIEELTKK